MYRCARRNHASKCGRTLCLFILVDSSKLLLYKNTNWFGNQEFINEQDRKLYKNAGLNDRAHLFGKLFRALDSFIYILRKTSPLNRLEAIEAALYIYEINLMGFINEIKNNGNNFKDFEKKLASKIESSKQNQE